MSLLSTYAQAIRSKSLMTRPQRNRWEGNVRTPITHEVISEKIRFLFERYVRGFDLRARSSSAVSSLVKSAMLVKRWT
jgi:hypothetical protein